MDFLIELARMCFILGTAAVFGGFFHQRTEKSKNITNGLFLGSLVGLGGYLLTLLLSKIEYDLEPGTNTWVVLVALVLVAFLAFTNRDSRKSNPPVWLAVGVLSAAAFALTFIWPIT